MISHHILAGGKKIAVRVMSLDCELFRPATGKVFMIFELDTVSARGDSWLHSTSSGSRNVEKCGEVGSAVSMPHQSDISLSPASLYFPSPDLPLLYHH